MGNSTPNGQQANQALEPLNQKDLDLIKSSWAEINRDELGITIMVRIFQEHKEIKGKWIFATNLETEAEMLSNSQVRYHAKRISDVISKIVEKLNTTTDPRQISIEEFNLVRLGRSHYHYNHFEESLIFALKKIMTDKHELTPKAEKAWRKVFWLIADSICQGIELEMKDKEDDIIDRKFIFVSL